MAKLRLPSGRMTRRRFLAGAGGVAAAAVGVEGLLLEPNRLAVTDLTIGAAARPSDTPLRAAVLTDLHLHSIGRLERAVSKAVALSEPDLVIIIGDAIDRADALPVLADFLSLLPAKTPKYATLGNWEHWCGVSLARLAATYGRASVRLLVNESAEIPHRGQVGVLVGVDDLVGGAPDLRRARRGHEDGTDALLLSHCPAYRDSLGAAGSAFSAVLSGHTHGGQIALGPWAPFRPKGSGHYVSGWYRGGGPDLFVSRGIGTSVIPVRLGSVPEVVRLEWFLKSV